MFFQKYLQRIRRYLKGARPARKPRKPRRRLELEALEQRAVPALLTLDAAGTLTYTASDGVSNRVDIDIVPHPGDHAHADLAYYIGDPYETTITLSGPFRNLRRSTPNRASFAAANINRIVVNLGYGQDELFVRGIFDPLTANGGDDHDDFFIGHVCGGTSEAGVLSQIYAPISIDGGDGAGWDFVEVCNYSVDAAFSYNLTSTSLTVSSPSAPFVSPLSLLPPWSGGTIISNYVNIDRLSVIAGDRDDTFTVQSTAEGTSTNLHARAGHDRFYVAPIYRNLDYIQGDLWIDGGLFGTDSVRLYDQNNPYSDTFTITSTSVTRSYSATVRHAANIESLSLWGGSGGVTYNIESTRSGTRTMIFAGPQVELFKLSPTAQNLNTIAGYLYMDGGGGRDILGVYDTLGGRDTYQVYDDLLMPARFGSLARITYARMPVIVLYTELLNPVTDSTSAAVELRMPGRELPPITLPPPILPPPTLPFGP